MSKYLDYFNKVYFQSKPIEVIKSQKELLLLLAKGYTLQKIAEILNKNYYNIQKRTQNLYEKFKVNNRADLIRVSIDAKILSTPDVTLKFKKRFAKISNLKQEVKLLEPLTERAINFLRLKLQGKSDTEIIKILNLYSTYPVWEIKRELYYKFNCDNLIQAILIAVKLEII
ncbi:MAG: LuxR C-terminal-related transcriptional regulator [Candidatus Gastranaerophilales bacterium]|nr:LuxR C-terminal-related transcriptional regulator [Candidatus Gastranaerophilales bacterium]MCM1073411.1 LuxR C-terminal-related transcriptional regulator [Bacteroides sp.]